VQGQPQEKESSNQVAPVDDIIAFDSKK